MLVRGLVRRCPRCGARPLFRRWFQMVERCPRCQYRFEREEGFFLGAYVINLGVTQVALVAYIAAGFALTVPDPPVLGLILGGVGVALVVPLLFYPTSKTVWAAIDLAMHRDGTQGGEAP